MTLLSPRGGQMHHQFGIAIPCKRTKSSPSWSPLTLTWSHFFLAFSRLDSCVQVAWNKLLTSILDPDFLCLTNRSCSSNQFRPVISVDTCGFTLSLFSYKLIWFGKLRTEKKHPEKGLLWSGWIWNWIVVSKRCRNNEIKTAKIFNHMACSDIPMNLFIRNVETDFLWGANILANYTVFGREIITKTFIFMSFVKKTIKSLGSWHIPFLWQWQALQLPT